MKQAIRLHALCLESEARRNLAWDSIVAGNRTSKVPLP
jgi:hypothetical protein